MSYTLLDQSPEGFEFNATVWKWKAALEVIRSLDILSENRVRQMAYNAAGAKVDPDEAHAIGEQIRDRILPKLEPDKRMFADLTVTDKPDDGTFFSNDEEQWKNFSVNYEWLKDFSDFCLRSKGFQIY
jgi:hypothetical protein